METIEQETLPSLIVQVEGRVVSTNLEAFAAHGRAMIAKINTDPTTDEDFAIAAKVVKRCEDSEKLIETVTAQALGQMVSVDELVKTMDALKEEFRQTRLTLKRKVESNKEAGKAAIINEARAALADHVAGLNKHLQGPFVPLLDPDRFKTAIKGLSSFSSMRDQVAVTLDAAKAEANEIALRVTANQKAITIDGANYNFLVHDFAQICTKDPEDFAAIMAKRVADWKLEQDRRAEQARQEEADRITREAAHKDAQEKAQNAQDARDALARASTPAPVVAQPVAVSNTVTASSSGTVSFSAPTGNELILIVAMRKIRALVKPDGEARKIIDVALAEVHALPES